MTNEEIKINAYEEIKFALYAWGYDDPTAFVSFVDGLITITERITVKKFTKGVGV